MPSLLLHNSAPAPQVTSGVVTVQHEARETAQYIADMVLELRNMAKAEGFGSLQALLELAYYEAFGTAHKAEMPPGEKEYLENLEQELKRVER